MGTPEDVNKPTGLETDSSYPARRQRFRRPLPNYPDSPIIIPTERVELAGALLNEVSGLWHQNRHYDSLVKWFSEADGLRNDAVNHVLLQEIQPDRPSLSSMQHETRDKPAGLVLGHYPLLTTEAVKKVIIPKDDDPITEADVNQLSYNPASDNGFRNRARSLGIKEVPFHDLDDFVEPRNEFVTQLNLEEARTFFLKLIPHINGQVKKDLLSSWGLVSSIRHFDLLADPRLASHLEHALLNEGGGWSEHLVNLLAQGVFPLPKTFEEAFTRLSPEDSEPSASYNLSVKDVRDTPIPASALYFTFLRKIIPLRRIRQQDPEFGRGREERIASYLLNDAFMDHALPYLELDETYSDGLVLESKRMIMYHTDIEATGTEGKQLKKKRLGEVVKTAIEYATEKHDKETASKLAQKYADFIS